MMRRRAGDGESEVMEALIPGICSLGKADKQYTYDEQAPGARGGLRWGSSLEPGGRGWMRLQQGRGGARGLSDNHQGHWSVIE